MIGPLRERFHAAGASFGTVAGQDIAISVSGLEREYEAIRTGLGVSDFSDMAKLYVGGSGALTLIDEIVAGNVERLVENSIRWTVILDERGRVVADVQLYRFFDDFMITCDGNARQAVLDALREPARDDVTIEDQSNQLAVISIEGPDALDLPGSIVGPEVSGLSFLRVTRCKIGISEALLGRIGFTGEFGYLLFLAPDRADEVIARLFAAAPDVVLCGRGVQDLLRLEVKAFNRAYDLLRDESALEAGLHWMIDFRKPRFRGREAIMDEKAGGLRQRLVGFVSDGDGTIERGAALTDGGNSVGYAVNAARSPSIGRTVGLAYLDSAYAWVGVDVDIEAAGGQGRARIVSVPFFVTESTRRASR